MVLNRHFQVRLGLMLTVFSPIYNLPMIKAMKFSRSLSFLTIASLLFFSAHNARAQFIGGVGADPAAAAGGATNAVGAGALGSDLGSTLALPLGSSAGATGAAVGAGAATGTAVGAGAASAAAVGGLSTTAALALGAVAVGAAAVALTNQGTNQGTTGTR